jgi:hypothetical protein
MEQTRITYCLRVKGTDELVRYSTRSNEGGYACVPVSHTLEAGRWAKDMPVYEQDDPLKLKRMLMLDTPEYNANYDTPAHGQVDVEMLEIIERSITEQHTVMTVELPPEFRIIGKEKKPEFILRRYANSGQLPDEAQYLTFLELPEGETVESIARFEGQRVSLTGGSGYITLYKTRLTLPEEYVLPAGSSQFAAVTSDYQ